MLGPGVSPTPDTPAPVSLGGEGRRGVGEDGGDVVAEVVEVPLELPHPQVPEVLRHRRHRRRRGPGGGHGTWGGGVPGQGFQKNGRRHAPSPGARGLRTKRRLFISWEVVCRARRIRA